MKPPSSTARQKQAEPFPLPGFLGVAFLPLNFQCLGGFSYIFSLLIHDTCSYVSCLRRCLILPRVFPAKNIHKTFLSPTQGNDPLLVCLWSADSSPVTFLHKENFVMPADPSSSWACTLTAESLTVWEPLALLPILILGMHPFLTMHVGKLLFRCEFV